MSMPAKTLLSGAAAREQVLAGVKKLNTMVSATMGPKGRNILLERGDRRPVATKDGVSVAQEIFLKDPFENMGAQMVKEAAIKTNDAAGDGTTTATLLAYSIMKEGLEHVSAGKNAISVKRGIDYAVAQVCDFLEEMKQPVDHLDQYRAIATVSAQDENVGKMIAEILNDVGQDGVVTVEASSGFGLEKELVQGMQFDNGYSSPYFVTEPSKMECVLLDCPILLTDQRITSIDQIMPVLDALGKAGVKRILIIADNVEGEAMATLIVNKLKANFIGVPVRAPKFGQGKVDFLMDIAAMTGATVIAEQLGKKLEDTMPEDLGKARRIVITKHSTTIINGSGKKEDIETRMGELRNQIQVAEKESEKEKLQERLAKLSGGIGIIKVGAATEFEQKELQHRVEDALSATKAAVEEGIVPGGGVSYVRAAVALEDKVLKELTDEEERLGAQIVFKALPSCLRMIAENAGYDAEVVEKKVRAGKGAYGFNAATGDYVDLIKEQIINPKKVERAALQNAASVAGMFLTLEGAMADERSAVTPEQLLAAVKGQ